MKSFLLALYGINEVVASRIASVLNEGPTEQEICCMYIQHAVDILCEVSSSTYENHPIMKRSTLLEAWETRHVASD